MCDIRGRGGVGPRTCVGGGRRGVVRDRDCPAAGCGPPSRAAVPPRRILPDARATVRALRILRACAPMPELRGRPIRGCRVSVVLACSAHYWGVGRIRLRQNGGGPGAVDARGADCKARRFAGACESASGRAPKSRHAAPRLAMIAWDTGRRVGARARRRGALWLDRRGEGRNWG